MALDPNGDIEVLQEAVATASESKSIWERQHKKLWQLQSRRLSTKKLLEKVGSQLKETVRRQVEQSQQLV